MIPHVVLYMSCVPTRKDGVPEFVIKPRAVCVAIPFVK